MSKLLFPRVAFFTLVLIPAFGQGDFEKGISYYKQKQYSKAIAEFEQITKENPDYETGFRVLGDSYLRLKQYREAAGAFRRAIELKGDQFVSYLGAGIAHFNLGEYRDAAAILVRAEPYAKSARARYQLLQTRGAAHFNLGDFAKAIADLEKANSLQRGEFENVEQLGIAYYQTGDYTRARTYLKQAVALSPSAGEASRFLSRLEYQEGVKALETGEFAEAEAAFLEFTSAHPEDGKAWFNLGLSQLFAEKMDGAETSFLKSAELLPDNWQVHDRLGYVYEVKKQYQRSLERYQKALSLHQDSRISDSVKRIQERISRQTEAPE